MQENETKRKPGRPKALTTIGTDPEPELDQYLRIASYVRFHKDVPPGENKEPVSEFRLKSTQKKYVVDSILFTPHGVVWKAYGETNIVPLANVIYCRFMV